MVKNARKTRRAGTLVGWFSVVAGLLLTVRSAFAIQHLVRTEAMDAPHLFMVALRAVGCLMGVALVFWGHKRLRRDPRGS